MSIKSGIDYYIWLLLKEISNFTVLTFKIWILFSFKKEEREEKGLVLVKTHRDFSRSWLSPELMIQEKEQQKQKPQSLL